MTAAVLHPLSGREAAAITARLAKEGIRVLAAADIDEVVHLYPEGHPTISEYVHARRAFMRETDAPIEWHEAAR